MVAEPSTAGGLTDFTVAIYRGCVLPKDYKPARLTTWSVWGKENPDEYSSEQLDLIRARLLAGRSWVCFMAQLETICAPDHYKPQPHSQARGDKLSQRE